MYCMQENIFCLQNGRIRQKSDGIQGTVYKCAGSVHVVKSLSDKGIKRERRGGTVELRERLSKN